MEYRIEPRIEVRQNVTATILGHPDVLVPCDIVNFSRAGMCIALDQDIPSGKAVKVNWDNHFLLGTVRHVAVERGSYRVGLELLYCSKWNDPSAAASAA
jgi:hypothetical protein